VCCIEYINKEKLHLSRIGLGTRALGSPQKDDHQWERTLHHALESGINLLDTAPNYQEGRSEELLGRLLKGKRQQVYLATKVGTHGSSPGDGSTPSLTTRAVRETLHQSMKRLQTDYIDILQIHYPDPRVDYSGIAATLQDLKQEGVIRSYGLSNFDRRELERWPREALPAFLQLPYNLLQQKQCREVVDFISRHNLSALIYTPLAVGLLGLPPEEVENAGSNAQMFYSLLSPEGKEILEELHAEAKKRHISMASLALAWTLKEDHHIALVGASRPEHLEQAVEAQEICEEKFISALPVIPEPVLPMEGEVTVVLQTGEGETLVQVKFSDLNLEIPMWVDRQIKAGDRLKIDGLSGKPL